MRKHPYMIRWNHRTHGPNNKKLFTAAEESNVNTKNFLLTECGAIGKLEVSDLNFGKWSDKPLYFFQFLLSFFG